MTLTLRIAKGLNSVGTITCTVIFVLRQQRVCSYKNWNHVASVSRHGWDGKERMKIEQNLMKRKNDWFWEKLM